MNDIGVRLLQIRELARSVKMVEAEAHCRSLLADLDAADLASHYATIRGVIDSSFLKKRRVTLTGLLDAKLAAIFPAETDASLQLLVSEGNAFDSRSSSVISLAAKSAHLRRDLTEVFAELSERHIFQWTTAYRERLRPCFDAAVSSERDGAGGGVITFELFADHSRDIFGKGAAYLARTGASQNMAVTKSVSGLQRFLELPIEFYATAVSQTNELQAAVALRRVCSAMIAGVLAGYCDVSFGDATGWQLLPSFPRSWAHYLGFLTRDDLDATLSSIEDGELIEGIERAVVPVVAAVDQLVASPQVGAAALPVLGQFVWESRRLDVQLRSAIGGGDGRLIEVQCYLDAGFTRQSRLEEAASRGVALLVAPLRPDLRLWVDSQDQLRNVTVDLATGSEAEHLKQTRNALDFAIARRSRTGLDTPLKQNVAQVFPLDNPHLARYFHVHRRSVQLLLRSFEQRNGIRLWCSVRRSGKTTACFDLGTATGAATVVTQTCDSTDEQIGSHIFYDLVTEAIDSGRQLSRSFVEDAVAQSSPSRASDASRYVVVLDEYETLFGRLQTAAAKDRELRYTVVQPLLNQLVAFGREHLLVFVGQQPDAHFILMDQNQLSAYVRQDAFPLFTHDDNGSEFRDLLRRIVGETSTMDESFVDAVYRESGGHPFLTVKVLIEFFNWLIAGRRSVRALHFIADDFVAFSNFRLTPESIGLSQEYQFFRYAIGEALGRAGREYTPWLHSVYSVLRGIAQASPDTLSVSRSDFAALVDAAQTGEGAARSADDLLGAGARANFFGYSEDAVWPRIPLLARIARAVRPAIRA